MKWIYLNLIIFISLGLITSCGNKKTSWYNYATNEVKTHINHKFTFPDSTFTPFPSAYIDSVRMADCKIVTCIDMDCSLCIGRLYYWSNFIHRLDSLYDISLPIIIYVYSETKSGEELIPIMNKLWPRLWIKDLNYEFIDKNNLHDERFQMVVLNKMDTIKLIGNLVLNPQMDELLIKYIRIEHEKLH